MFEKGWSKYCDVIILSDVDYETQKQRVMKRDNISAEDFDKINDIQIKNSDKKFLCDIVIDTNKKKNLLKAELIKLIENIGIL